MAGSLASSVLPTSLDYPTFDYYHAELGRADPYFNVLVYDQRDYIGIFDRLTTGQISQQINCTNPLVTPSRISNSGLSINSRPMDT